MAGTSRVIKALESAQARTAARLSFVREFADQPESSFPFTERQKTVLNLARCLARFADLQFRFFLDGFTPEGSARRWSQNPYTGYLLGPPGAQPTFDLIYPIEYAFERTQSQVNHDLDVIFRALSQRIPALTTPALVRHLEHADKLANLALWPAVEAGLITPATVLTYFQKSPAIRIIPYAPVALTGIPFAPGISAKKRRERVRDFMMIPHEIGHQVFWRLAKPDLDQGRRPLPVRSVGKYVEETSLRQHQSPFSAQQLSGGGPDLPQWLLEWTEEIFADVYGCLIAGVLCAETIQEILKGLPVDQFLADNGVHPSPVVRPLIHIQVLRERARQAPPAVADQLHGAANELRKAWRKWLLDRRIPLWFRPQGSSSAVTVEEAESLLGRVVSAMVRSQPMQRIAQNATMWTIQLEESTKSVGPSAALPFQHAIATQENFFIPELVRKAGERMGWSHSDDDDFVPGQLAEYDFVRWRDDALERGMIPLESTGYRPWWLAVLEAGSWLTGPGGPGHVHT